MTLILSRICVVCLCLVHAVSSEPLQRPNPDLCYFRNGQALCGPEGARAREEDRKRVLRARLRTSERSDFYIPRAQNDDPQADDPFIQRQAAANDKGNVPPQEFVAPEPETVKPPTTTTTTTTTQRPCPLAKTTTTKRPCPLATTTTQSPCPLAKTTTQSPCPLVTTTLSPCDAARARQRQYQADEPIQIRTFNVGHKGITVHVDR